MVIRRPDQNRIRIPDSRGVRGPLSAGPFVPTNIASLRLWLDFSDATKLYTDAAMTTPVSSDGDVIGAAEDKSGRGNDFTQSITANKPLYKTGIQNGLSAGLFDGADDFLESASALITEYIGADGSGTVIAIIKTAAGPRPFFYHSAGGGRLWQAPAFSGTIHSDYQGSPLMRVSVASTVFQGNWSAWRSYRDANVKMEILRNEVSLVTKTSGISGTPAVNSATATVGTDGSSFFKDYIGEIFIFNDALSAGEVASMETFTTDKWAY